MTTTEYKTYRRQTVHSWCIRKAKSYAEAAADDYDDDGNLTPVERAPEYDEPGWVAYERTWVDGSYDVVWVALDHGPAEAS